MVSKELPSLPGFDLEETAMYFMKLLGTEDLRRLEETMRHLDNCTINVGTACSGTDIAVSVTKATISALAKHFKVSCHIYKQ